MRWLVLQLFSEPLGVVQRHEDTYKTDTQDDNDIPTLYIRNEKLSYGAVMVLAMVIVTFRVLTLSSAVSLSLLRVTRACSEDPRIDCYPQLISGANTENFSNLTISIDESILDCAPWNSEGVSSQVTFICFRFMLNVEAFPAATGGLLTIFIITMKFSTAALLWLSASLNCHQGHCLQATRVTLVVVAAFIEIGLALTCLLVGTKGTLADNEKNSLILRFIAMHASKALIMFGVVATLLWLPWEKYVQVQKRSQDSDDEIKLEAVTATPGREYVLM